MEGNKRILINYFKIDYFNWKGNNYTHLKF